MRRSIKNRLPLKYKKLKYRLTLRFYISLINNRLTERMIKEFLKY